MKDTRASWLMGLKSVFGWGLLIYLLVILLWNGVPREHSWMVFFAIILLAVWIRKLNKEIDDKDQEIKKQNEEIIRMRNRK